MMVSKQKINLAKVGASHPLPLLKINDNLRFRKVDIDGWLGKFAEKEAA
jgi:hypothetical protein